MSHIQYVIIYTFFAPLIETEWDKLLDPCILHIQSLSTLLPNLLFCAGACVYVMKPASGSVLSNALKILFESCRLSCRKKKRLDSDNSLEESR